jgi:hypothetical protein
MSENEHPLGRKRKTHNETTTSTPEPSTVERRSISWGHVNVRTPKANSRHPTNDKEEIKWKDHRRHLGSFEDEKALRAMSSEPKSKIQLLKEMRKMRRAALRDLTPARKILTDPKGQWVFIVVLVMLTLAGVHFFCDTWIEALTLLTFVTVCTFATATVQ